MDKLDLKNRTAVITGAARGLGLACAEALASAGCNIAVLDILPSPSTAFHELLSQHNNTIKYYAIDITLRDHVIEAVSQIVRDFGRIDININAASLVIDEPFLTTSDNNLQLTFAINVNGNFLVAQACANAIVEQYKSQHGDVPAKDATAGIIVFISSNVTYVASTAQQISCYTASKAAIKGLVKPLAMELSPYGIRVNSLSPGYMMTDMMRSLQSEHPDLFKQLEKETLFDRIGLLEEIKGAMLWLCSSIASGWYTGQDLVLDGGATSWKHPAALA